MFSAFLCLLADLIQIIQKCFVLFVVFLLSLLIFMLTVREPQWAREMREDSVKYGIEESVEEATDGNRKLSPEEKRSLLFILASIVLWFMGYNAITSKYSVYASNILHKDYGLYEPPERLSSIETIRFIREIGAVAVWAHPYFHMTFDQAEEFLPRAVAAGLQGMETLYSTYDDATKKKAREVCRRFGICESGGSDFHGSASRFVSNLGEFTIADELAKKVYDLGVRN